MATALQQHCNCFSRPHQTLLTPVVEAAEPVKMDNSPAFACKQRQMHQGTGAGHVKEVARCFKSVCLTFKCQQQLCSHSCRGPCILCPSDPVACYTKDCIGETCQHLWHRAGTTWPCKAASCVCTAAGRACVSDITAGCKGTPSHYTHICVIQEQVIWDAQRSMQSNDSTAHEHSTHHNSTDTAAARGQQEWAGCQLC